MRKPAYTFVLILLVMIFGLSLFSTAERFRVISKDKVSQKDKKNRQGSIFRPNRIVSANLGADQILLEMVPEKILAVSYLAVDPRLSHVSDIATRIPNHIKPDPEQILVLDPDLVILGRVSPAAIFSPIEESGAKVFRFTEYQSIEGVEKTILELGSTIGASEKAAEIVSATHERLESVSQKIRIRPKPGVVYYNLGGFTGGKGSFIDNIIEKAGGQNLAVKAGITGTKKLSLETLVEMDPDVLVIMSPGRWDPRAEAEFLSQPVIRELRAFKTGKIFVISARYLFAPSHHAVEGVEDLARFLHPEAFDLYHKEAK